MKRCCLLALLLFCSAACALAQPSVQKTVVGSEYRVDPVFLPVLQATVDRLRAQIREQRGKGKLIGFVSIPLSSRNGGDRDVNVEVSESIKKRLERRFGADHFWALAPGLVESTLPAVQGKQAQGGEYMYLWTQVLAGGLTGENDLVRLKSYLQSRSRSDPGFAERFGTAEAKRAFLGYYALKASTTFSDGSHDEWNIFWAINQKRREINGVAGQLPILFDGRQVPASVLERPVSKGYQL